MKIVIGMCATIVGVLVAVNVISGVNYHKELEIKEDEIDELNQIILSQGEKINEYRIKIDELNNELDIKSSEISTLNETVESKNNQIAKLKKELEDEKGKEKRLYSP